MRFLLTTLLVANVLFYGWTAGWFDAFTSFRARGDREPDRVVNQLHADAVVILQAGDASDASSKLCFEAGPIGTADAGAAEGILNANLPAGAWVDVRGESTAAGVGADHVYRVAGIDAETAAKLADLKLDPAGRVGFKACAKPALPVR